MKKKIIAIAAVLVMVAGGAFAMFGSGNTFVKVSGVCTPDRACSTGTGTGTCTPATRFTDNICTVPLVGASHSVTN